ADDVRYQHLTRRRQPADPRGDVDRAAVDVVLLSNHIPGVQAQVQRQSRVAARRRARDRRLDGLAGRGEDGEDTVAEELAFDRGARVPANPSTQGSVPLARLCAKRAAAEVPGEGSGIGEVGEEDDGCARG